MTYRETGVRRVQAMKETHWADPSRAMLASKREKSLSDPSELAGLLESRLPRAPTKLSQRNRGSPVVASPKRKLDQAWRLR